MRLKKKFEGLTLRCLKKCLKKMFESLNTTYLKYSLIRQLTDSQTYQTFKQSNNQTFQTFKLLKPSNYSNNKTIN